MCTLLQGNAHIVITNLIITLKMNDINTFLQFLFVKQENRFYIGKYDYFDNNS